MSKSESEKIEEYNKKCNSEVKLCQTCIWFKPTVFDHNKDYFNEELGHFTLWVWEGICKNPAMPNKFPKLYHETKSDQKCEYYITKKEYQQLIEIYGDETDISVKDYLMGLAKIRGEPFGSDKM